MEIIILGLGIIFCILTGKALWKKDLLAFSFFVIGVGCILWGAIILKDIPNGLPVELKKDGNYEVRIVDVYREKDGGQWVAVQILKEEGKTIEGRLPYRKISKSKFGNANIVYGIPLTIELKTFPSQQYLAVK